MSLLGNAWIPILPLPHLQSPAPGPCATFTDFLAQLDLWESQLFLELEMHVGCYKFMTIVNSQDLAANATQLITVSDGSDDSGSMTFGWVIATPDGRRLARCSGPVFGPFGSSFRAEGYGFLSVSQFLVRLQEF
jgi:hypothetical protein